MSDTTSVTVFTPASDGECVKNVHEKATSFDVGDSGHLYVYKADACVGIYAPTRWESAHLTTKPVLVTAGPFSQGSRKGCLGHCEKCDAKAAGLTLLTITLPLAASMVTDRDNAQRVATEGALAALSKEA